MLIFQSPIINLQNLITLIRPYDTYASYRQLPSAMKRNKFDSSLL